MTHNLEATVFVYRHRETREIRALYMDDASAMTGRADYEHIATLEPRMWIEAHYDDAEREREACAKLCDDNADCCHPGSVLHSVLGANATAIRARGSHDSATRHA